MGTGGSTKGFVHKRDLENYIHEKFGDTWKTRIKLKHKYLSKIKIALNIFAMIKHDKMDYVIYDSSSSEDSLYECFSQLIKTTTDIPTALQVKAQLLHFSKTNKSCSNRVQCLSSIHKKKFTQVNIEAKDNLRKKFYELIRLYETEFAHIAYKA